MTTYADGYGLVQENGPIVIVQRLSELGWLEELFTHNDKDAA
jgi:hypothetical protein